MDFKYGHSDAVVDQVLTYGIAAQEGLRLVSPAGWMGAVAALDAAGEGASNTLRRRSTPQRTFTTVKTEEAMTLLGVSRN